MFCDEDAVGTWEHSRRRQTEALWPEYKETTELMQMPAYTLNQQSNGKQWLKKYLFDHVQKIQELKQHHVHIWDEEKQDYMVLEHCAVRLGASL